LNDVLKKEIEVKLMEIKAKYEKELTLNRKELSETYEVELEALRHDNQLISEEKKQLQKDYKRVAAKLKFQDS
jgi:hypothetical protein